MALLDHFIIFSCTYYYYYHHSSTSISSFTNITFPTFVLLEATYQICADMI